jgi:hypothetical protein
VSIKVITKINGPNAGPGADIHDMVRIGLYWSKIKLVVQGFQEDMVL